MIGSFLIKCFDNRKNVFIFAKPKTVIINELITLYKHLEFNEDLLWAIVIQ